MPAHRKPLPKQWPKRERGGQNIRTSNRAPWRKDAPIKAFLPVPILNLRLGLAHNLYGIFTDWKGKRRDMRLGSEIKAAKDALALRDARNIKREDFDADNSAA